MGHSPMEITVGINVGHVNTHQKTCLPVLEDEWIRHASIPTCSLEMATGVHDMSACGGLQQCGDGLKLESLAPSEVPNANMICFGNKRDRDYRWLCGRDPGGKVLNVAGNSDSCGSAGGSQGVLTGRATNSGLGFADLVIDANARRDTENQNRRYSTANCHLLRPRDSHNVQQPAERKA